MDKFITIHNGRMPLVLNDIRFLDGIYRNAFELFLKTMEANNSVLFGCLVTDNGNGTFSVTEGAVVINSEVYICSAHSFVCTDINQAYFVITETFDPQGLKKYGDNVNRDTYQLRRIVAEQHASQPANSVSITSRYEFYTKSKVNAAISTAIASLVDSSPSTLDTLNELAAALGDDPNFSTTILNALGNKVDKIAGYGLSKNDLSDEVLARISPTKRMYVEIGDWDMDAYGSKTIESFPVAVSNIRAIGVIIRNDSDSQKRDLGCIYEYSVLVQGWVLTGTGALVLYRKVDSIFDGMNYDSTDFNRGWIAVDYVPE